MSHTKPTTRTVFSVIEVTEANGARYFYIDWHPAMHEILDEVSPNAEVTNRIIDIAEELLCETEDT